MITEADMRAIDEPRAALRDARNRRTFDWNGAILAGVYPSEWRMVWRHLKESHGRLIPVYHDGLQAWDPQRRGVRAPCLIAAWLRHVVRWTTRDCVVAFMQLCAVTGAPGPKMPTLDGLLRLGFKHCTTQGYT